MRAWVAWNPPDSLAVEELGIRAAAAANPGEHAKSERLDRRCRSVARALIRAPPPPRARGSATSKAVLAHMVGAFSSNDVAPTARSRPFPYGAGQLGLSPAACPIRALSPGSSTNSKAPKGV
jgi:hypothetical protein